MKRLVRTFALAGMIAAGAALAQDPSGHTPVSGGGTRDRDVDPTSTTDDTKKNKTVREDTAQQGSARDTANQSVQTPQRPGVERSGSQDRTGANPKVALPSGVISGDPDAGTGGSGDAGTHSTKHGRPDAGTSQQ